MVIARHLMDCMWTLSSADAERDAPVPPIRGCERRQVKTSCVVSWRADRRDGSGESGWGASWRKDGRLIARPLTSGRDQWRATDECRQVEPNLVRRRERRRGYALIGELGRNDAFPKRDRLGLAMRSSSAVANTWLYARAGNAQQRKLQGTIGEPSEEEVASHDQAGLAKIR